MQISKLLSAICAVAFCAGFISVRADDTPAQAAARATLEAKMSAMSAQGKGGGILFVPITNSPPVEQKISGLNQPQQTQNPPPIYAPASPQMNDDNAEEAALHRKMAELDAQKNAGQRKSPGIKFFEPVNATQTALDKKMAELDQEQAAAKKTAVKETPPAGAPPAARTADMSYPGKDLGLKPIEAPALPISADKQAQLQALDSKYMANQITPEEYHKQRAEILGEP